MTGGMLSAFGGAMGWGQPGVDWALWLQHMYWGMALGAIGGAVFQGTVAIVGTGSAATAAASAPSFAATWYGGLLTYAGANGLADVSMQMTALVFGLQETYSPLQTLGAFASGGFLYGAFRGGAALWTRFRTTPRPDLAPQSTVRVYRVEGTPNTRVFIGENGEVAIVDAYKTLYLNFGDRARAEQYLAQKLNPNQKLGPLPGAEVKSFEVPKSFVDELRSSAVPEALAKQNPGKPIIVDVTKAPDQFGLRPEQIEALKKAIIQGSGKTGF
jgi:hypothetical protein